MTGAALEATDLYRFFHAGDDETLALRGVSLTVAAGEVVAVTGPSGSGKSTLLACLAGLDEPDGGVVRIDGERLSRRPEDERARVRARRVGMLFQQANLVGHLSVDDNVELAQPLGTGGRGRPPVARRAPGPLRHRQPRARPRGAALGRRARARRPGRRAGQPARGCCWPTSRPASSTRPRRSRVVDLLHRQAADGAAVVLVTHSPEIAALAHREVRLSDGRVVA